MSESPIRDTLATALADRYRIERELGRGGMATVYLAEDRKHDRKVAIKVLRPELAAVLGADRFVQEIKTTANLQHPHILPVHDSGEADGFLYYVMPYVEGESLRDRLARQGELPLTEAVRILRDVADALADAHAKGVVHRDIKPDNIMLSGRHALVADFGVAKAVAGATGRQALTTAGVALGTPTYMAPEQAAADPHTDHRADLYAFGAMAYEMVTGQPPFTGTSAQAVLAAHVIELPVDVSRRRSTIPLPLAGLIMRCLAKKPADRPQSAEEILPVLEALRTPGGGITPVPSFGAAPRSRVRTLVLTGAWVVMLAVAGLALWRLTGERPSGLVADPNVVAVLPFRVAGADPGLQYLGEGMLDLLAAKLTGAGGPRAADVRSVLAALRGEQGAEGGNVPLEAAERAARQVGAGRIVQGSIVGGPTHFVLSASLVALNGGAARQASVEGPQDSLFVLVDRLTAQLLALGANVTEQQLHSLTTTSLEALRAYLDGVRAYRRGAYGDAGRLLWQAVQIDTSFALATSMLVEALGWGADPPDVDPSHVRRLAWQNRDRLTGKDRLLLENRLGPRYPRATPFHVRIADLEQAARIMPESPDAWYNLGDAYYHGGAVADVPDARARAAAAFERALEQDSLFVPALDHLAGIRVQQGDTAAFARLAARFASLDSGTVRGGPSPPWALVLAVARRDHAGTRSAIEHLRTGSFYLSYGIVISWLQTEAGLEWVDTVFAIMHDRASTSEERTDYLSLRYNFERGRGHLRRAAGLLDSLAAEDPGRAAYKAADYWWYAGDTTLAKRFAARPPGDWWTDHWLRVASGDASAGDEMLSRLDSLSASDSALSFLIRANTAYARRAPNALALLEAADSTFRGWSAASRYALWIARLYVGLGRPQQALRVLQREAWDNFPPLLGFAERRLMRGRLAELVGDRAVALAAYRDYLVWRSGPDPELVPQLDSVRASVARLERGR